MKNKEQIELAQELILDLQDYVELAKVEKKLKVKVNQEQTGNLIDCIVDVVKSNIDKL